VNPWTGFEAWSAHRADGFRARLDVFGPSVRRHALPGVALLLAILVFVPCVSLVGSWASPAPLVVSDTTAQHSGIAPAQLVPPAVHPVPILLLVGGAMCLGWPWPLLAAAGRRWCEVVPPPGRRGRALLHAYLN
jgi:hypothetical protein